MDTKMIVELIGYAGSALVMVSMLMTSVTRLRVINLTGNIIFSAYALMIRSYPTALMNMVLAVINIYHLFRLRNVQKNYTLISTGPEDGYLAHVLRESLEDIRKWFPEYAPQKADVSYLLCHDGVPAGIFLGKEIGEGALEVILDYAMPAFRDTSVGQYLYRCLAQAGYRSLSFRQNAPGHVAYMEKIGYKKTGDREYTLDLTGLK